MRIIICGAGQVGYSIAQQLSREDNEIAIIDYDAQLIQRINDQLDVKAYVGHASHPATLKAAGADNADMLIAVTYSDEVNMVACQIGYSLFNIPTRIARIRHQDYLDPQWAGMYANDQLAINVIISPEVEVARAVIRRLHAPGAIDTIPFVNDKVRAVAVNCLADCPVINLPLAMVMKRLAPLGANILALVRGGKVLMPEADLVLREDDDVYFVAQTPQVRKVMSFFGHNERDTHRAMILGGGNIGLFLARALEEDPDHPIRVKVIERDRKRAEEIARQLNKVTVLCGNALDREILSEAGIDLCETAIAVTNDDETNILSALLAKQFGAERGIALVNNATFNPLLKDLGIDVTVNPREITVSRILEHVRRGKIAAVHAIADGLAEIIEAEVLATSSILGKRMTDISLPKGIIFGAIIRKDGSFVIPDADTVINERDHIIILASAAMVSKVEQIFSVSVEYF